MSEEAKNLIGQAKNICLIPSAKEPEAVPAVLALFYTLKELGKNVNLLLEDFPEKLNFLIPSLDFISSPKNFVVSIPRSLADISQIYYEKNEEHLKIHLTVDKGYIKKEQVSFYFQEAKPDLVVTLGVTDFQSQLSTLDAFGFLLDVPLINIDNHEQNTRFGKINIVEQKSLSEILLETITSMDETLVTKNTAHCLLTGLVMYYENFQNSKMNSGVFQTCGELMGKGALHRQIIENLYKTTEKEMHFLGKILESISTTENQVAVATLDSDDFKNFAEAEAASAIEKIKALGIRNDLLVLWQSHASDPMIKGFFYSKKPEVIGNIAHYGEHKKNNDWMFVSMPGSDIRAVKDTLLTLLS